MRGLSIAIIPFLACLAANALAAAEAAPGGPQSESSLVFWILVGVFAFFALIIGFTWQFLKSERKRLHEQKSPE